MKGLESRLTDIVSGVMPWLAPAPCAFLVGRACLIELGWPLAIAMITAVIIECLGLSASITALELREYNASKKKTDPGAPAFVAFGVVGLYLAITLLLVVFLDVFERASVFAVAFMPFLSLAGMAILALRSDHRRRMEAIKEDKESRRADRLSARNRRSESGNIEAFRNDEKMRVADKLREGRRAAIAHRKEKFLNVLNSEPTIAIVDAARLAGISRGTGHSYIKEMEAEGILSKNGHGWEVKDNG